MITPDTRTRLDEIKARADAAGEHIGRLCTHEDRWKMSVPPRSDDSDVMLIQITDTNNPAMAAALTAVLDLHKPEEDYRGRNICAECLQQDEWGDFYAVTYPCQTAAAITDALGGDRG